MSKEAPRLSADRRDLHSSISPAVFSEHARLRLIPDIEKLGFPDRIIASPLGIAQQPFIKESLEYSRLRAQATAKSAGTELDVTAYSVHHFGYGDRHFVPLISGAVGEDVCRQLLEEGRISTPLSLMDYANMFQTGWYGDLMNTLALTGQGRLQPAARDRPVSADFSFFQRTFNFDGDPYQLETDPETGLHTVKLTKKLMVGLRADISSERSVGCPVARTAFTATGLQAGFLESHGFVGPDSGFVRQERVAGSGKILFKQPSGETAIHDVVGHWGHYLERYALHLMATQHELPDGILPTDANTVILLD